MNHADALVHAIRDTGLLEEDRRVSVRHLCSLEATSQSQERGGSLSWGAAVEDISTGGLGLSLCYPFHPGTYLAIDLRNVDGMVLTVLVRVVHVRDAFDGTWRLGCEFVKPLTDSELDMLI